MKIKKRTKPGDPCSSCKGRKTHVSKSDHPKGAGHPVPCTHCRASGVEPEPKGNAPK